MGSRHQAGKRQAGLEPSPGGETSDAADQLTLRDARVRGSINGGTSGCPQSASPVVLRMCLGLGPRDRPRCHGAVRLDFVSNFTREENLK
jgi:hypothetical protein